LNRLDDSEGTATMASDEAAGAAGFTYFVVGASAADALAPFVAELSGH
jgi:hypothetical protein